MLDNIYSQWLLVLPMPLPLPHLDIVYCLVEIWLLGKSTRRQLLQGQVQKWNAKLWFNYMRDCLGAVLT